MKYESSCTFGKTWEYRKGKKSNGDATELDIGRQRIRTTAKSIRVSDCYSVVLIRHVSWTQWFWGGGYSAKSEVSIGRFGLVCWFSIEIEQARVRVRYVLSDTFDVRVHRNGKMKRWSHRSRLVTYLALFSNFVFMILLLTLSQFYMVQRIFLKYEIIERKYLAILTEKFQNWSYIYFENFDNVIANILDV